MNGHRGLHRRGHGSVIRLDFGDRPAQAEDAPQQETKLLAYRAASWLEGGIAGCTLRRRRGYFGWCREWPPRSHRGGTLRVDLGDHPAQANAVAHAPSHYDPLKIERSQPEVAAGWIEGGHQRTAAGGCDEGRRLLDFGGPGPQVALGVLSASIRIVLRVEARQQALSQLQRKAR